MLCFQVDVRFQSFRVRRVCGLGLEDSRVSGFWACRFGFWLLALGLGFGSGI